MQLLPPITLFEIPNPKMHRCFSQRLQHTQPSSDMEGFLADACIPDPGPAPEARVTAHDAHTGALTVELHHVDAPLLSAIRHALRKDVSCLALDYVALLRCTSPWEPEFIANRVGQLPVAAVDPGSRSATDGDGAMLEAWVRAPSEAERPCEYTLLSSGDFRLRTGAAGAAAPRAAIVHARSAPEAHLAGPGFQVCLLLPGQEARLRAVAHRGTGRRGTRWDCVHVTQVQGPPHAVKILKVETTGAVRAREALRLALVATVDRLRAAAASL